MGRYSHSYPRVQSGSSVQGVYCIHTHVLAHTHTRSHTQVRAGSAQYLRGHSGQSRALRDAFGYL